MRAWARSMTCLAAALIAGPQTRAQPTPQTAELTAEKVLAKAGEAYRRPAALEDTLTLRVTLPNTAPGERIIHYRLGEGSDASLHIEGSRRVTAIGERVLVEMDGVDTRYAEIGFGGDLAAALDQIAPIREVAGLAFRAVGLWEPPHVALRAGKPLAEVLDAFRLTPLLEKLEIAGYRRLPSSEHEIRLEAVNGACAVRIDAESFLLASVEYVIRPSGLAPQMQIRMNGRYAPRPLERAEGVVRFDPTGRSAVAVVRELSPTAPGVRRPPGELVSPETLTGRLLSVGELSRAVRHRSVLLLGEDHFLVEPQDYAVALMERLDDRPISLLLELPADAQPDIDRYLDDCSEAALEVVFAGREALPLGPLLRWSCANRERLRTVVAMDEDLVEILLRRMFLGDTRNRTMAEAIHEAYRRDPDGRVVAYAGQMHMMRGGRYRFDDPSREPAGSRLPGLGVPPGEIASIMLSGGEEFHLHEVWDRPGAVALDGALADIPFSYFIDYPIFGVENGSELIDFFVNLGPLTPIPREPDEPDAADPAPAPRSSG